MAKKLYLHRKPGFKEYLEKAYLKQGLTMKKIGEELGCTAATILSNLRRFNIPIRETAEYNRGKKRPAHAVKRIIETHKGKALSAETKEKISITRKSKKYPSPNWNGGKRTGRDDGYVQIYMPDHPFASKDGYVMEHRLVRNRNWGDILPRKRLFITLMVLEMIIGRKTWNYSLMLVNIHPITPNKGGLKRVLNRCILIGRLTKDPELRYTPNGVAVAKFTLAVDRRQVKDREKETDFISVVVWQKLAENCANYIGKGRLVAVDGRLQIRSYDDNQGIRRKVSEVVAENVRFLDKAKDSGSSSAGQGDFDGSNISFNEDEIPF